MSYCVRCGVELQKGCNACPLCDTEVLLPEEQDTQVGSVMFSDRMPRHVKPRMNLVPSKSFLLLATFILLLPLLVTLFVDFTINRTITWSFYPITSLALLWILIAYPSMLKGHTVYQVVTLDIFSISIFLMSLDLYSGIFPEWSQYPALSLLLVWFYIAGPLLFSWKRIYFVLAFWFIGTAGFLLSIDLLTGDTDWFLPLGLPIISLLCLAGLVWALLSKPIKDKPLLAVGSVMLIAAIVLMGVDATVNLYVEKLNLTWSPILVAVLIPTAIFMFIINGNQDLKAYLIKKFHI